jgi:hypothetical protein
VVDEQLGNMLENSRLALIRELIQKVEIRLNNLSAS